MVATRDEVDTLLDAALAASEAEQTEVLYMGGDEALTRFATNQIHQNVREHDATIQVRVIDRQRTGVASTNRLDAEGPHGAEHRALHPRRDAARARRVARIHGPLVAVGSAPGMSPDVRAVPLTFGIVYLYTARRT